MSKNPEMVTISIRARGNLISDASRTFVVADGDVVIGYHGLAAGAIGRDAAPKTLQRNRPDRCR